ncbi:hypothetical protein OUZ56_017282 [Daphnia magna]|uniref:Uncharacterized protein n=1 Tax=Daphnia magna TaxID=35525 RepID=A0ABR0ASL0_9CRUS|nr:hypothetical protein OUZ56_017282 [Daphnia magna]
MEGPQAGCMIGSGLEGCSCEEVSASSRVLRCSTVASSDFKVDRAETYACSLVDDLLLNRSQVHLADANLRSKALDLRV